MIILQNDGSQLFIWMFFLSPKIQMIMIIIITYF